MTKTMTPSEQSITAGQIGKIQELLGAGLRKSGLQSEPTQVVLETQGDALVSELVSVIRKRVKMVAKIITHRVKVDRTKTPQEIIDLTGRYKWYIDPEVLAEMPKEGFEEGEVVFFELDYDPSVDELGHEYEIRGLKPDPYVLAQAMTNDPSFADERPVAVQWRDKHGRACDAIFYRRGGRRKVVVSRNDNGWFRNCRFAGSRK